MALVYASDVKHDGEYVRKRGDKFAAKDAKDLFELDDPSSLVDEGILVHDSLLPENDAEQGMSLSYNELEAAMLRKNEEAGVTPDSSLAGDQAKAPLRAQAQSDPAKADKDAK